MPIRNETADAALARLRAVAHGLAATPWAAQFDYHVLSDTDRPDIAAREAAVINEWMAAAPGTRIFYRRRSRNGGYKAGNIAEFLDRCHARYEFFLPLDADSSMGAAAILRLLAGKAFEVGQLLERAIEAGRGHLEPVVVDVLDLEHALQLVAYGGAIVDRDAALDVEEDAQQAALGRELDIHEFVPQSGHHLLDQSLDIRSHLPAPPLRRHVGRHK